MKTKLFGLAPVLFIALALSGPVHAATFGVGLLVVDLPAPSGDPFTFEFDVANETGADSSNAGNPSNPSIDPFPISGTTLLMNVSSLLVIAADGSTPLFNFGSGYFGLDADGQSLDGSEESYTPTNLSNTLGSATITGTFSTTSITLDDGSMVTINPGFTAVLTDPSGSLQDGDFAVIYATTPVSVSGVPEPGTWLMLLGGLAAVAFSSLRRFRLPSVRLPNVKLPNVKLMGSALAICATFTSTMSAVTTVPVKLSTWTVPSSGVAGTSEAIVTGSGFPAGTTAGSVTMSFASTCGGTVLGTATGNKLTVILGTEDRVQAIIPAALTTTGNYFISIAGTTGSTSFASTNCSEITVTVPVKFSGACLPSSSIGLSISTNGSSGTATAYVPNGAWGHGPTGIQVVPLEPITAPTSVPTPNIVNACSSSPTGQSVCTANNTDVYVLTGTAITSTLTSGSDIDDGFSGGDCENCGVAINPNTNQAVISMGLSGFAGGYQFLNLGASPSFVGLPIGVANEPSENIVWDASRDLILSPNESANYDVIQVGGGSATMAEFAMSFGGVGIGDAGGEPDSAGEDCSTGIAMSTDEFTGQLFFSDLTQAVFTAGTPGTWTAPGQWVEFPEFDSLGAGTSGMAVAPGSHYAVIAGEFGGSTFGVVQLPATSGSGTPGPVDYVAANLPTEPDGSSFEAGYDPHTVSAYTSPNTGKALAVMADGDGVEPCYLALVDMAGLLAATRSGAHTVDPSVDLVGTGLLTWVATGNACGSGGGGDAVHASRSRTNPNAAIPPATQIRKH